MNPFKSAIQLKCLDRVDSHKKRSDNLNLGPSLNKILATRLLFSPSLWRPVGTLHADLLACMGRCLYASQRFIGGFSCQSPSDLTPHKNKIMNENSQTVKKNK